MSILSSIRARLQGRNEPKAWLGVAGHGLRLSLRTPVQVEHRADGQLRIGRHHDGRIVTVLPGTEPAARPPSRVETEGGAVTYCCDARGPAIIPSDGQALDPAFIRLDTGPEPGPWKLLGFGCQIAFLAGFAVVAEGLDHRQPFFELHLSEDTAASSFIRFHHLASKDVEAVLEKPGGASWSRIGAGRIATTTSSHPWVEFAYKFDGAQWHQRRYFLPVDSELGVLALAQATEGKAGTLFAAGEEIARSFTASGPTF